MRTKSVLWTGLFALLAGQLFSIAAADQEQSGDIAGLQGTWNVVAGQKAGRKTTDADRKDFRLVFSAGKCVWTAGGKATEMTFSLDSAKNPRQIDLNREGKTLAGIYQLDGNTLKICLSASTERPSEFVSKEGEKTVLLELVREER